MTKILLFDIDETLMKDGNKAHVDAFDYAFKTVFNQPTAAKNEIKTDGMIDRQIILEILKLHGVSEEEAKAKMDEAMRVMEEYFIQHENDGTCILKPGVKEILVELQKRQVPMGLLTGNVEEIAWRKVARAGLKEFFTFGAFGNLAYKRVDLIPIAVERAKQVGINAPLTDFIIVSDSPLDVRCAKAGGIQVIAVGAGNFSSQELRDENADLVIDSFLQQDEIFKFLQI